VRKRCVRASEGDLECVWFFFQPVPALSFFVPADRRKVIKERWREFFANPSQWWDHRLEKVKQKIVAVIRIAFVFAANSIIHYFVLGFCLSVFWYQSLSNALCSMLHC
jgi:hypothetical protein